jgi:uncharacterized glyoxalase superfamily protein PhnB
MRVIVFVKADHNTEAGVLPSEQLLTEMGRYNEALVQAGIMKGGDGLHPSAKGVRVLFSGPNRRVIDGPFAETKELVAGFWIWEVRSMDEAIEWAKRCPNPTGEESVLEIRPVFEADDFGEAFTPELRAQEERLRAQIEQDNAAGGRLEPVPPPRGATPYLIVRGAPDAIAFYQQVFGATVRLRLDAPDGSVMHAELAVGVAAFMLSEEQPQWNSLSPLAIGGSASSTLVYVPDVDAVVERAVAAGAKVTMPVADQFWGDRSGHIVDPFGHQWFVSTRIEEPTPEELQRRIDAMFAQQGAGPAGS